jgi:hypothetical protein
VLLLNECLLLFISLSTQSGNFWIHPRIWYAWRRWETHRGFSRKTLREGTIKERPKLLRADYHPYWNFASFFIIAPKCLSFGLCKSKHLHSKLCVIVSIVKVNWTVLRQPWQNYLLYITVSFILQLPVWKLQANRTPVCRLLACLSPLHEEQTHPIWTMMVFLRVRTHVLTFSYVMCTEGSFLPG